MCLFFCGATIGVATRSNFEDLVRNINLAAEEPTSNPDDEVDANPIGFGSLEPKDARTKLA